MISWIIILLGVIITAIFLVRNRQILKDEDGDPNVTPILKAAVILIGSVLIASFQPFAVDRVDQGNIGLKVNLTGDDRGISDYKYETGWVIYNVWTEAFYQFPVFQQHIDYGNQQVITKGGFSATINPTFNYNIKSSAVGDMFSALRVDVKAMEQGWLKTAIVGSVVDVANRWTVDDIFNKREEFEAAIRTECNKRVSKWFEVSQLRTNITPPAALQEAIEAKTKAIQQAQAEDQKALTAEAEARKKVAIARGDSAEVVINASGRANARLIEAESEAKAIRLKQQEVSAVYVEYLKAQKWDGVLPSTVLGNSTPMINIK